MCLRRCTGRTAEMTPSCYHRACSYIPSWNLRVDDTSVAHGAHAPNDHPPADTPSPDRNGEILKHNMMMHISSGPTLTDKVVSIDLLSRFRE